MGYSDFDRALLDAWHRVRGVCKNDSAKLAAIVRRRGMATYVRPLRSWSLVLRACDSRIDDNNTQGLVRMDGARIRQLCSPVVLPFPGVTLDVAARLFGVNRTTVSRWTNPPESPPPPEGQGKTKTSRSTTGTRRTWYQEVQRQIREHRDMKWPPSTYRVEGKRLMLEYFLNRADRKRSEARVWTPSGLGLDPGGEVWSGDWGETRGVGEARERGVCANVAAGGSGVGAAWRYRKRGC